MSVAARNRLGQYGKQSKEAMVHFGGGGDDFFSLPLGEGMEFMDSEGQEAGFGNDVRFTHFDILDGDDGPEIAVRRR